MAENEDREQLGQVVDSIAQHPGLQTVESEQGEAPANDPYAEGFYARHTPAGQQSARQERPAPHPEQAEQAGASGAATESSSTPAPPTQTRSAAELEREIQRLKQAVQDRNTENLALKAATEHFETLAQRLAPPQPQAPRRIPIAFDEQNQPYVSPDEIERQAADRVRLLVDQRLQESLRPLMQASEAYSRIQNSFPEFAKDEAQFTAWLNANPEYRERIAQDPGSGMEAAYLRYHYDAGRARSEQVTQSAAAAQATVSSAQRHAAPAGGASTPTRRITEVEARDQKMQQLLKYAQETGDFKPLYKARLEEGVGVSFLDTMGQTTWGR